jgi:hemoglobin-like flavoprotein
MDIHQSIDDVLESDDILGKTFYDIFLTRYPELQKHFADVNMQRQAVVLAMALLMIEQYDTYRYPAIAKYLRELGSQHQRRQIPVQHFPRFRDAMLEALAQHHGSSWNEPLGHQWRQAIDRAASVMLEGYQSEEKSSTLS